MPDIYHRICIQRSGYAIVPGNTPEEIRENAMKLGEHDFDWESVTPDLIQEEMEIIEDCTETGASLN